MEIFLLKSLSCREVKSVLWDVSDASMHHEGLRLVKRPKVLHNYDNVNTRP